MNRKSLVLKIIVQTLGYAYRMRLFLNEMTRLSSLNNTRNVLLLEMKIPKCWIIFLEPIYDMMADLYYYMEISILLNNPLLIILIQRMYLKLE